MVSIGRAAGAVLVLSNVFLFPGLFIFWARAGHKGGAPRTRAHYVWERSLIMASVVLAAIGLTLLLSVFLDTPGLLPAWIGAAGYFFAGVLLVAGEALNLNIGYEKVYPLFAAYAVIAFLSQAVIGYAILQTGLVAAWTGWVSIAWNLGWLVLIPVLSPRDIYFPVLHAVMPLLVGIALLLK